MVKREISEVDVGELSRAKMITELGERHENHIAELARFVSWFRDTLGISNDGGEATCSRSSGQPALRDHLNVTAEAGFLEQLTPGGVGHVLGGFDHAPGELIENGVGARTILTREDDLSIRRDRDDGNRSIRTEYVPLAACAVGQSVPTRYDKQESGGAFTFVDQSPSRDHARDLARTSSGLPRRADQVRREARPEPTEPSKPSVGSGRSPWAASGARRTRGETVACDPAVECGLPKRTNGAGPKTDLLALTSVGWSASTVERRPHWT